MTVGNTLASLDFLRHWRPEGPWVLTAISPEQRGIASETFTPASEEALEKWVNERQGKDNIYFTVNPLLRPMSGPGTKAAKVDVQGLAWLHVDVDPRPGENIATERERALRIIRAYVPPPTVIIDSGGGYQGFWKLDEVQIVNGNENRAIEMEAYNLQIALTLTSAGVTHNIDRIMRLPGTINIPNEKKRKAGRVPTLASLVEGNWDRVYPLSSFTAAQRVQPKTADASIAASGPAVRISGNLPKINLDELPDRVTARTKMLIVQGTDPDEPTKYPSRSEACFAVCCELVRAGCSDDQIAAILLDADFGISGHVLHQSRPQNYAARQIQRAREEAIHPRLRQLNEKHAIIEDVGGKCRVVSEIFDEQLKRSRLSLQSFDDFRGRYMHMLVDMGNDPQGDPIRIQLGKFWLSNPSRRQYGKIVFAPGREVTDSYNLWRGFGCEAKPGTCDRFLDHVKDNICSGSEEHYDYLMDWMARAVQHPDSPGEIAVVLRGRMGTGKGKFTKVFGSLWGRHFLQVSNSKHLVGQFNSHLRDCVVLFGDEAFFAGDKSHESMLKTLITEEMLMVEAKGVDAEPTANYVHLLLASNSDWVVPAGADDRRFFVLNVSDAKAQDPTYFAAIDKEIEEGGREALLHALMTRDIRSFQVRNVPKTVALRDQKLLSLTQIEEWWFERLTDGKLGKGDSWPVEISKDDLVSDMNRYFERQKIMRRPSPTSMGRFLLKIMPDGMPRSFQKFGDVWFQDDFGQNKSKKQRLYFYQIADLTSCRVRWDKLYGGPFTWLEQLPVEEHPDNAPPF